MKAGSKTWGSASRHGLLGCFLLWLTAQPVSAQQASGVDAGPSQSTTTLASPERIDALQTLATGVHPGVPLDSLLSVSLDDDSSLNERDKEVRLERRKVLIASRVAERFKNKSPEELQTMRDQVLALDLERKVLTLPIEVRSRLIDEDAQRGSGTHAEAAQGSLREASPEPPQGQSMQGPKATPREATKAPAGALPQEQVTRAKPGQPDDPSLLASVLIFFGSLLTVWLAVRLFRVSMLALAKRSPAQRGPLVGLSSVGSLILGVVGTLAAPFVAFAGVHASMLSACGLLLLALLAVGVRDLAASFLAGCALTLTRPFRVGDRIELESNSGKVVRQSLFSTQLLTPQNRLLTIPNATFVRASFTAPQADAALAAIEVDFYVDANQDVSSAKQILEQVLTNTRGVDVPKGHSVLIKQILREQGCVIRLRARVFISAAQAEEIESELTERVLEGLRTGGVRAPSQVPTAPRVREPTEPFAFG